MNAEELRVLHERWAHNAYAYRELFAPGRAVNVVTLLGHLEAHGLSRVQAVGWLATMTQVGRLQMISGDLVALGARAEALPAWVELDDTPEAHGERDSWWAKARVRDAYGSYVRDEPLAAALLTEPEPVWFVSIRQPDDMYMVGGSIFLVFIADGSVWEGSGSLPPEASVAAALARRAAETD